MNSVELNKKLVSEIPELKEYYYIETKWQDGDETGSHIVFEDVLVPFIKEQLNNQNQILLKKVFVFLEEMLNLEDEYSTEVVAFSVMESLYYDDEIVESLFAPFMGTTTNTVLDEIKTM